MVIFWDSTLLIEINKDINNNFLLVARKPK